MISRSGTFTSGAASGVEKILREEGSGPVVTAGRVVSGLERMFISFLRSESRCFRHCEERSDEAIHLSPCGEVDCFASLAMTMVREFVFMRPRRSGPATAAPVHRGRRSG